VAERDRRASIGVRPSLRRRIVVWVAVAHQVNTLRSKAAPAELCGQFSLVPHCRVRGCHAASRSLVTPKAPPWANLGGASFQWGRWLELGCCPPLCARGPKVFRAGPAAPDRLSRAAASGWGNRERSRSVRGSISRCCRSQMFPESPKASHALSHAAHIRDRLQARCEDRSCDTPAM
jgi:hypothetical protein